MECRQQSQELNPVDGNPKDLKKSLDESAGGRPLTRIIEFFAA